jgi:hypothetical protein
MHRPPTGSCFLKMAKRAELPEKGARLTRKRASPHEKRVTYPKKRASHQTKFSSLGPGTGYYPVN